MKRILFLVLLAANGAVAQNCSYAPADCPTTRSDPYGSPEDSISRLGNPVLPREITMENRLRVKLARLMERVAQKEGWEVVQLSEDLASGERDANGDVLAYPLRPPHWIVFHYQFIVNTDSLRAWDSWQQRFAQRRMDNMNDYSARQAKVQGRLQALMDSATYYGQKGNLKKMNELVEKAAALQKDPQAEKADVNFEAERKSQRVRFRDASVLIVEIGLNVDFAKTPDETPVPPAGNGPIWLSNTAPDPIAVDLINRSHTCALLLSGNWKRSSQGGGYAVTLNKKISCDQIQTITVHLSGNAPAIRRCLADWPGVELDQMMVR
jgi:hypothetical protein